MKDHAETSAPYPGSDASTEELLQLAEAYMEAADTLFESARKGAPLSYAPARLCAIHAIELFQNAFLRSQGEEPTRIRSRLHDLEDDDFCSALQLRKKTAHHLKDMTARREYLISRYAPERTSEHTEVNRLRATLAEVQAKVAKIVRSSDASVARH